MFKPIIPTPYNFVGCCVYIIIGQDLFNLNLLHWKIMKTAITLEIKEKVAAKLMILYGF